MLMQLTILVLVSIKASRLNKTSNEYLSHLSGYIYVEFFQKGRVVDPTDPLRGPIRLRLASQASQPSATAQ